ncbi:MAG: hypothetical protein AB1861_09270 [Cyanobacteriota bacterium]
MTLHRSCAFSWFLQVGFYRLVSTESEEKLHEAFYRELAQRFHRYSDRVKVNIEPKTIG